MFNFVISVTFFSILSLIFILWIFEQESLWSFQRETFRFVDKRIQCLSSAAETRNDFSRREFWDIQEEKVGKVLEWNTRHLSWLLKLIPVCVHKKKRNIRVGAEQRFTIKTINQSMLWQLSIFSHRQKIIYGIRDDWMCAKWSQQIFLRQGNWLEVRDVK